MPLSNSVLPYYLTGGSQDGHYRTKKEEKADLLLLR